MRICADLLSYGKFGTYDWAVPQIIFDSYDEYVLINFLQGLYDSEGHAGNYNVDLSSVNSSGLAQVKVLLKRLGIDSKIYGVALVITKKDNIRRFRNKIGFTIKRKINKLNSFYGGTL